MVRPRRDDITGVKDQHSFYPDFNPRANDPPVVVRARAFSLIPCVNPRLVIGPHAGRSDCLLAVVIP